MPDRDSGFEEAERWRKVPTRLEQLARNAFWKKHGKWPKTDEELAEGLNLQLASDTLNSFGGQSK